MPRIRHPDLTGLEDALLDGAAIATILASIAALVAALGRLAS